MSIQKKNVFGFVLVSALATQSAMADLTPLTTALSSGKAYGDFRLRYDRTSQDNAAADASALTLRTRIGYTTGIISGFSATVEFEDSRIVLGQGDYSVGPTGYNVGQYSVIADPETTELDQALVQYQTDKLTVKLGRQLITMDNHRFIGHVGWRQDRQTFDGASIRFTATERLILAAAYLNQRNRIFSEAADLDSKDLLLNIAYSLPKGKLSAYSYQLDVDNGVADSVDTVGLRYWGYSQFDDTKLHYTAEFATQDAEAGGNSADYLALELGTQLAGVKATLSYESLGSDNGAYGFSTPLATLHKFNGWADLFLGTPVNGLVDQSLSLSGKVAGGKWKLAYHDFSADHGDASYGSEIDFLYAVKFAKQYNAGFKYAAYSADSHAVDTDKLWLWVGAKF